MQLPEKEYSIFPRSSMFSYQQPLPSSHCYVHTLNVLISKRQGQCSNIHASCKDLNSKAAGRWRVCSACPLHRTRLLHIEEHVVPCFIDDSENHSCRTRWQSAKPLKGWPCIPAEYLYVMIVGLFSPSSSSQVSVSLVVASRQTTGIIQQKLLTNNKHGSTRGTIQHQSDI